MASGTNGLVGLISSGVYSTKEAAAAKAKQESDWSAADKKLGLAPGTFKSRFGGRSYPDTPGGPSTFHPNPGGATNAIQAIDPKTGQGVDQAGDPVKGMTNL